MPIDKVIKQEERNRIEAEEAVKALRDVAGLARESDSNPLELMKSIPLIRAGGKGLLHTFPFGLVTILLFKGLGLWILLTLLLAVIFPFYYIHRELKALGGDSDDDEYDLTIAEANHVD